MGFNINTDASSINAMRQLESTTRSLSKNFERLSSGLRITSASDDAAGLGVSEGLSASMRSLTQAMRNTNDGASMLQTAEGAYSEVASTLMRMRELAVQSSSETLANEERGYIQDEFSQLSQEIDRIAEVTSFNGQSLLDGSAESGIKIQVGISDSSGSQVTVSFASAKTADLGGEQTSQKLDQQSVATASAASSALSSIDAAIEQVSALRADVGASSNRLGSAAAAAAVNFEKLSEASSRIRDVDFASESSQLARETVLRQAGVAILAQANQSQQSALRLLQ